MPFQKPLRELVLLLAISLVGCVTAAPQPEPSVSQAGEPVAGERPAPMAAAPASPDLAVHSRFELRRDQVYTPVGWPQVLKADVYLPDSPGLRPAVLLIHGGGWASGDRRKSMTDIAQRLASRGYVVAVAAYRGLPQYRYPAPVEDLREVLKALRKHAAVYRVRPDRIAAFGYSAGGHLALMLGATGDSPETQVQAVVAGGAPYDLRETEDPELVSGFLGGSPMQWPLRYAEASPIDRIKPGDPPVFLYHGERDQLVRFGQAQKYQHALQASGVEVELYPVPGGDHYSSFRDSAGAVEAAIGFLDRQLRRQD